jgi:uncharacterized protein DUF3592
VPAHEGRRRLGQDPGMAKLNVRIIVGAVFAPVGLILLGVAAALAVSSAGFASTADRAKGTVVDLAYRNGAAYPYVTYVSPSDRREYTFGESTGSWPPAYAIGERVPVVYDPDHPGHAHIDSWANKFLGPTICGGLGVVFTTIGALLLILERRRAMRSRWLRTHGRERWVEVAHIGPDFSVRLNGQNPLVVHASWRDERSGRIHTASSDHLWHYPGPELLNGPVRVLFDPADPDRNLIDL